MNILVTGGAGFIGSNLVRHLLATRPHARVSVMDMLTYAGVAASLRDCEANPRYRFFLGDICDTMSVRHIFRESGCTHVMHLAAESHVDRSIAGPDVFAKTNVLGTQVLLDAAREFGCARFLYVSTDEVMGSLGPGDPPFDEESPLAPNSPYAASKAGGELLVRSYHQTFGLDTVITRCSNNYGPYQFPEKLIPLAILRLLEGGQVPVYGDGLQVRDWLHVSDHCLALLAALEYGDPGGVYCIGGKHEVTNLDLVRQLCELCERDPAEAITFVADRLGHDRRYAIDPARIRRELAWEPTADFAYGLADTVSWYRQHRSWWEPLLRKP